MRNFLTYTKPSVTLAALTLVFIVTACSNKQVYNGIQTGLKNHCYLYPYEQAQECLRDVSMPFDEYERKRAEALEKIEPNKK